MYQHFVGIGHLARDPELRYTTSSKAVCNFTVAINSGYGDKQEVIFLNCVAWNKTAENVSQYLSKGSKAMVAGKLQERSWEKDGQKHSKVELLISTVQFLDGKRESQGAAPPEEVSDIEPF